MLKSFVLLSLCYFLLSQQFSDFRLPTNTVICSILQETKCEWKNNWKGAEGVRRKLDAGKPSLQFYYFCRENRTQNCGFWIDENNERIKEASALDRLVDDNFVIEEMDIKILGDYAKLPEEKGDRKLIIE